MASIAFNEMARRYDKTRTLDPRSFSAALDYLVGQFPPTQYPQLFEPGIGTGRIAIPLAERGYRVTGVDIAEDMLAVLAERVHRHEAQVPISWFLADATRVPFPDAVFDMAVVVNLFHLVRNWRSAVDELLRVLHRNAPIILIRTRGSLCIPGLFRRYKEICARFGVPISHPGSSSIEEVVGYCTALGYRAERIRDRWKWVTYVRLDEALRELRLRTFWFSTIPPDDIHANAVGALEFELLKEFGCLTAEVEVRSEISFVILRKEAGAA